MAGCQDTITRREIARREVARRQITRGLITRGRTPEDILAEGK
jgi:hypothetical protein